MMISSSDKVVVKGKVWGEEGGGRSLKEVGVGGRRGVVGGGVIGEEWLVIVVHEEKEVVLEMMVKTPRGSKLPLLDLRPSMTILDLKRRLGAMPRFQGMVTDSTVVSIEGVRSSGGGSGSSSDGVTLKEVGVDQGWRVQLMVAASRRGRAGGVCILLFGPNGMMSGGGGGGSN